MSGRYEVKLKQNGSVKVQVKVGKSSNGFQSHFYFLLVVLMIKRIVLGNLSPPKVTRNETLSSASFSETLGQS